MTKASEMAVLSRRGMLAAFAAAPAFAGGVAIAPEVAQAAVPQSAQARAQAALKDAKGTKLVILGSGAGPIPGRKRHMAANVMLSNGEAYVLDCGLGVTDQFARTGIPFKALNSIFITHHHPDHNVEFGPLLLIGWVEQMPLSVRAFGPPPLQQMTEDLLRAYGKTVEFWSEDFRMPPLQRIAVQEVSMEGPVMEDANVRVSAVLVNHPPVVPSFGYRFDFHDRSIAFSGDTTPLEAVARMARGADVLVHEVILMPQVEAWLRSQLKGAPPAMLAASVAHMRADHSPAEDVGRIAQEAGVKTLVLSHLSPGLDSISDDAYRAPVAKRFKGEIIVAHDLMVI